MLYDSSYSIHNYIPNYHTQKQHEKCVSSFANAEITDILHVLLDQIFHFMNQWANTFSCTTLHEPKSVLMGQIW